MAGIPPPWAAYYTRLDETGPRHHLWSTLRAALPKQKRRRTVPPTTREELNEQWVPHFARLEAGDPTTPEELLQQCLDRQQNTAGPTPALQEYPTLCEVERLLRQTPAGKASGHDGLQGDILRQAPDLLAPAVHRLFTRILQQGHEPIQMKGGLAALLHKGGDIKDAKNYRAIVLLSAMGKRLHAWLRSRVVTALLPQKPSMMIGGFPGPLVQFGSHAAYTLSRIAKARAWPHAMIYLDVKGAFHALIREFVVGRGNPQDLERIYRDLDPAQQQQIKERLEAQPILRGAAVGDAILHLLREAHTDTWVQLPHDATVLRTCKGTRPGSPVADIIYRSLMTRLHVQIERYLAKEPCSYPLFAELGIPPTAITWSDDVAIPILSRTNAELVEATRRIFSQTYSLFYSHGLDLNMKPGKTSWAPTFCGEGAPEYRRKYQVVQREPLMIPVGTTEAPPRATAVYKHLGSLYTVDGALEKEVHHRMGQARTTFVEVKRTFCCNKRLQVGTRLQFLESLVLSQLFFSIALWTHLTPALMRKLEGFVYRLLCQTCGHELGPGAPSYSQLLTDHLLPDVATRMRLARLRYAGALWQHGPQTLLEMTHTESKEIRDSWWAQLQGDLRVLTANIPMEELDNVT